MDAVLHHIPVYMWAPTLFGLAMGARFFFHAAGTFRTLLPQSVVEVEDALLGDDDMSIRDVNRLREAVRSRLAGTWILSFSASIAASMWSIASWPDSTAYLYFNSGYLTWLCALYFFWKMEWLGRSTTSHLFSWFHVGFMIIASCMTGPTAGHSLLHYYAMPVIVVFFCVLHGFRFGIAACVVLSFAVLFLERWPPLDAPMFCHSCMAADSHYLPLVLCITIVLHFSLFVHLHDLVQQVVLRSLKRSASLKDEFIASLSHELKTPLNGIIGTTHLLGLSGEVSGEMREHIATLSHCANALSMLVENVLEQGNTRVETKLTYLPNVNVRAFFEEAVAVVRSLGYKRGTLQVTLTVEDSVPETLTLCPRLLQVLLNLGSNAIKFQREGTVEMYVALRDNKLEIEVRDEGPGVSLEFERLLFQPYQRDPAVASVAGTGLGLSISRRLVHQMKGHLGYRRRAKGSVFYVHLPVVPDVVLDDDEPGLLELQSPLEEYSPAIPGEAPSPVAERRPWRRSSVPTSLSQTPPCIVVVEDDVVNRRVMEAFLARLTNATRVLASDGVAALSWLLNHEREIHQGGPTPPIIVLLDLNMPFLDGKQTARLWRNLEEADPKLGRAFIVAVTAGGAVALKEPFDAYLPKPLQFSQLESLLNGLVRKRSIK